MTLTPHDVKKMRTKGIHMELSGNDEFYRYTFSDFNTASQAINDKDRLRKTFQNTPLIGKDASDKGLALISVGSTYDCNHMDNFIKSDINKRQSHQPEIEIQNQKKQGRRLVSK